MFQSYLWALRRGRSSVCCYWISLSQVDKAQVAEFLDALFLPYGLFNEEVYDCKKVETKEILSTVWKYSKVFDTQNVNSFGKWLKSQKISLTLSPSKRTTADDNEKVQARNLYIMKDVFLSKFNFSR